MRADPGKPISWCCTWTFFTRRPPFHGEVEQFRFDREADARAKHAALKGQFGDDVVAVVTPVFARQPVGDTVVARRASLDAFSLPRQLSPRADERAAKRAQRPPPPKPRRRRREGE